MIYNLNMKLFIVSVILFCATGLFSCEYENNPSYASALILASGDEV